MFHGSLLGEKNDCNLARRQAMKNEFAQGQTWTVYQKYQWNEFKTSSALWLPFGQLFYSGKSVPATDQQGLSQDFRKHVWQKGYVRPPTNMRTFFTVL